MTKKFDLVVIGTGTAASTVASQCRNAGWQVAMIDSRPFGGTCALRGCDPKKVLVGAAEVIDWNHRMKGKGIEGGNVRIVWPDLMRFKRSFTDPVPKSREDGFLRAGMVAFHGRARFVGPRAVQVGDDVLEGRSILVATGARPVALKIPGEERVTTSDQFLELEGLPRSVAFIGGGYISFEFAHIAARAGAKVVILHRGARPLNLFDPDLVDQLVERTRALGIDIQLNAEAQEIKKTDGGLTIGASVGGTKRVFEADMVVHGAGRVPEIEDLDLQAAGVEWDKGGVKVNEYLQSVSNQAVYAAGDAAASGGAPLTPVAGYDGRVVAANLLEGNRHKPDYLAVSSVVFTIPPLASVGLQEQAAREKGLRFEAKRGITSGWYTSRRIGEEYSGYKVLVEEGSGRILGAHLLGAHSDEMINFFALAMRAGLRASDLQDMIYAYPTNASNIPFMV